MIERIRYPKTAGHATVDLQNRHLLARVGMTWAMATAGIVLGDGVALVEGCSSFTVHTVARGDRTYRFDGSMNGVNYTAVAGATVTVDGFLEFSARVNFLKMVSTAGTAVTGIVILKGQLL